MSLVRTTLNFEINMSMLLEYICRKLNNSVIKNTFHLSFGKDFLNYYRYMKC